MAVERPDSSGTTPAEVDFKTAFDHKARC